MDDVELDEDGHLKVNPVVGWTPGTPGGAMGMIVFRFVRTAEQLERRDFERVQLAMSETQLVELQQDISRMLAILRQPTPGGPTS